MQKSEKRADPRRTIRYPGLITLDGEAEPIPCALRNASQQGSQLAVSDVDKVPDEFVLVLGHEGTPRRFCRVVWRSKDAVGVEFNAAP
jgi:PilZ domain-containing protein